MGESTVREQEMEEFLRGELLGRARVDQLVSMLNFSGISRAVKPVEGYEDWKIEEIGERHNYRVILVDSPGALQRHRQRTLIKKLMGSFPWALFVFTDTQKGEFHLVHPTYSEEITEAPEGFKTKEKQVFVRLVINDPDRLRTASERLSRLSLGVGKAENHLQIWKAVEECFSIRQIAEGFFEEFKKAHELLIRVSSNVLEPDKARFWAQVLLSRMMFVYFLERKKGLLPEGFSLHGYWSEYRDSGQKDNFLSWLRSLFFGAFKNQPGVVNANEDLPPNIKEQLIAMPFLNGGLFEELAEDKKTRDLKIRDVIFSQAFGDLFEAYNFTITEESPWDVEVAVDPEMLGRVYESLIAREEHEKDKGIFYTPRVEIDLMNRLTIARYLSKQEVFSWDRALDVLFNLDHMPKLSQDEARALDSAMDTFKLVDPAVGSGSFLTSAMRIIYNLKELAHRTLHQGQNIPNPFEVKRNILFNSLYGVDAKDWAVKVGELRLWLSLIVETPGQELLLHAKTGPLLPNLDYNLRVGDSLLEEVAETPFILRVDPYGTREGIKEKIRPYIKKLVEYRKEFFDGNTGRAKDIEAEKTGLIERVLEGQQGDLRKKKEALEEQLRAVRQDLYTKESIDKDILRKGIQAKIQEIDNKLLEMNQFLKRGIYLKRSLSDTAKKTGVFLWEIEFPEVFFKRGGFDAVVGNPPYVRQEQIASPFPGSRFNTKRQYKEWLKASFHKHYKVDFKRTSDYYVYFYVLGLSLLNKAGSFAFVTSNSWIDVDYGTKLKEYFNQNAGLFLVMDSLAKRSFASADFNTVITLFDRENNTGCATRFLALKMAYEDWPFHAERLRDALSKNMGKEISVNLPGQATLRFTRHEDDVLRLNTVKAPDPQLKWGGYFLRAPGIFFTVLDKAKDKLVRLGDVAEIKRGFTTGANAFFYLRDVTDAVDQAELAERLYGPMKELALEKGIPLHPDGIRSAGLRVVKPSKWGRNARDYKLFLLEEEYLRPVIQSTKEIKRILLNPDKINYKVFDCHESREAIRKSFALLYIEWGESECYNERPSVRSRSQWYAIPYQTENDMIILRFRGERNWFPFIEETTDKGVMIGDTVFVARLQSSIIDDDPKRIKVASFTNATVNILSVELFGRVNLGEGLLTTYGPEIKPLPLILDINSSSPPHEILDTFTHRDVKDIFTELGFDPDRPIRQQQPKPLPDRKAIDDAVFDALGLTQQEREEVYYAVAELVQMRLNKARSV